MGQFFRKTIRHKSVSDLRRSSQERLQAEQSLGSKGTNCPET